jgi:hypothetical protein
LWPVQTAVQQLESAAVSADEVAAVRRGQAIACAAAHGVPAETELALFDAAGQLVGIGVVDARTGRLQPRLVLGGMVRREA